MEIRTSVSWRFGAWPRIKLSEASWGYLAHPRENSIEGKLISGNS